jgi:superoxide dismutase, Cu-Zn family
MDSKLGWRAAAWIGVATLFAGCAPDTADRDIAITDDEPLARDDIGESPGIVDRGIEPAPVTPAPGGVGAASPGQAGASPTDGNLMARAEVRPVGDSNVRGVVEFYRPALDTGPARIDVMLMGLDAGPHGFHVHEGTDCMAPGDHLNPQNSPHGPANAAAGARHIGDLGNVTADASGMVDETVMDSLLGDADIVGKVVVVHSGQDDLTTQPDGESGDPVACGVIEAAEEDQVSQIEGAERGV